MYTSNHFKNNSWLILKMYLIIIRIDLYVNLPGLEVPDFMKKIAAFLVDKRFFLLGIVLCLTVVCGIFTFQVKINTDMTKYLPDDSP